MDFQHLRRSWEVFAATDPLHAIVTAPGKYGNRWDRDEFFGLGRREVDEVFADLARHGLDPPRGRALDFGCGVGRLTRFFADRFETAVGVDISSRMVELAREFAPTAGGPIYVHNPREDLALFADGSFDFVFSTLVLQHMRPDYAMNYVREFLRLIDPDGVVMFALTNHTPEEEPSPAPDAAGTGATPGWRTRSRGLLSLARNGAARGTTQARMHVGAAVRGFERKIYGTGHRPADLEWRPVEQDDFVATMEMYAVPVEEVVRTISAAGGVVTAVDDLPFVPDYEAKMYYARREPRS